MSLPDFHPHHCGQAPHRKPRAAAAPRSKNPRLLPLAIIAIAAAGAAHAQGTFPPLTDPATPVMRTLTQVEPRTPIPAGGVFTISTAGSYYLTGNITVPSGSIGIAINAGDVTLDLNGFTISSASTSGTTLGIRVNAVTNVTIRNGSIRGGSTGVFLTGGSSARRMRIENLDISDSGSLGIYMNAAIPAVVIQSCTISHVGNTSYASIASGIAVLSGASVRDCEVDGVVNSSAFNSVGINCSSGCFVTGNTIKDCDVGISGGKYARNLTYNCATPFSGGTDVSGNN